MVGTEDVYGIPFLLVDKTGQQIVVGRYRNDTCPHLIDDGSQVRRKTVHLILIDNAL